MISAEGLWDVGMVDGCPSSNEANCEVEYGWVVRITADDGGK